jgi:endoglycosylceramidase
LVIIFATVAASLAPSIYATPTLSFLSTRGPSIIDSTGQAVILRGVNYPGYEQPDPKVHDLIAYRALEGFGFNVVRLPISWANLEQQPGAFDSTYLASYVDQDVQWANSVGIYIILDMHQYHWADRFDGYGIPDWAVQNYAPNETGMRRAVSDFWSNSDLQGHLVQVWVRIAQHYANEPTIAGYDLLNEPWVYTSVMPELNATAIDVFYSRAIGAIGAVDPNHIIFLEPANMNVFKSPTRTNIVWSPHFYQLSFAPKYYAQNFTSLENDMATKYETFVARSGAPMWIGEFGAFMPDNSSRAAWTEDALTLFNRYQVGWAWWAYDGYYTSIPNQLP